MIFRHFAALGALIVVLSPASDPFLQAVITYAGKLDDAPALSGLNQATDLQALVNRSERWASFDSFVYTQDTSKISPTFCTIIALIGLQKIPWPMAIPTWLTHTVKTSVHLLPSMVVSSVPH